MSAFGALTFGKEERIVSRTQVATLFKGGRRKPMTASPIRVVYLVEQNEEPQTPAVQVLVSVSKRYFKHAVDRNRVKRQIRESYRHSKHILYEKLAEHPNTSVSIAFIWLDAQLHDSANVERKVTNLLRRIGERL